MTNNSQDSKQGSKFQEISRIQGTDGIRALSAASTHPLVARATPLDAFLKHERITEQFMELYAYAYVTSLPEGSEVVLGWDPRDPQAFFTNAVVSGVRKAGAHHQNARPRMRPGRSGPGDQQFACAAWAQHR